MSTLGYKTPESSTGRRHFQFPPDAYLLAQSPQSCAQQCLTSVYDSPQNIQFINSKLISSFRKKIVRLPPEEVPKAEADSTVESEPVTIKVEYTIETISYSRGSGSPP